MLNLRAFLSSLPELSDYQWLSDLGICPYSGLEAQLSTSEEQAGLLQASLQERYAAGTPISGFSGQGGHAVALQVAQARPVWMVPPG